MACLFSFKGMSVSCETHYTKQNQRANDVQHCMAWVSAGIPLATHTVARLATMDSQCGCIHEGIDGSSKSEVNRDMSSLVIHP